VFAGQAGRLGHLGRWLLLAGVIVFMTGLAYAVHQVAEVRFAPRLKAWLTQVPGLRPARRASRRAARVTWIRPPRPLPPRASGERAQDHW
jgi:hypothetical protein